MFGRSASAHSLHVAPAPLPHMPGELGKFRQVRPPQRARFAQHVRQLFQPLEKRGLLKGKVEFRRIQHMKDNHLVPAVSKML